jgi:hypothetical protein
MRYRLAVLALAGALVAASGAQSQAPDRHVRIINETRHTMVSFYASNTAAKTWEEDILGSDTLPPGQDVRINIDDGTETVKHDINVCEISSYRYTE